MSKPKPKHPMPVKRSKKNSKEVRSGLLAGDTPAAPKLKITLPQQKQKASKKGVHRAEKRNPTRTPHADDGTWERVGESKLLEKARSFTKSFLKHSRNRINQMFSNK